MSCNSIWPNLIKCYHGVQVPKTLKLFDSWLSYNSFFSVLRVLKRGLGLLNMQNLDVNRLDFICPSVFFPQSLLLLMALLTRTWPQGLQPALKHCLSPKLNMSQTFLSLAVTLHGWERVHLIKLVSTNVWITFDSPWDSIPELCESLREDTRNLSLVEFQTIKIRPLCICLYRPFISQELRRWGYPFCIPHS